MKKIFFAAILLFALAACGGLPAPDPPDGFVRYVNAEHGFSVFYPEDWEHFDSPMNAAQWLKPNDSPQDGSVNINIVIHRDRNMTQRALRDRETRETMQDVVISAMSVLFDDVSVVSDMSGRNFGGNYFVVIRYNASAAGRTVEFYQAVTAIDGVVYTFTLTVPHHLGTMFTYMGTLEDMLRTLR